MATKALDGIRSADGTLVPLSARQLEILELIASGLSNKDIGAQLDLTTGTVKQHLNAIFTKLGVSNRTWAASIWQEAERNRAETSQVSGGALPAEAQTLTSTARKPLAVAAVGLVAEQGASADSLIGRYAHFLALAEQAAQTWGGELQWSSAGIALCTFGVASSWLDVYERGESFIKDLMASLSLQANVSVRGVFGRGLEQQFTSGSTLVASTLARETLKTWFEASDAGLVALDRESEHGEVPELQDLLVTAPFMGQAQMSLKSGRGLWLSVEAWPPRYGKALLDALAAVPPTPLCTTLKLRLPVPLNEDSALILGRQIASQVDPAFLDDADDLCLNGWIRILARRGATQILVYGQPSLAGLRGLIDPDLMVEFDRLAVLIVFMSLPSPGAPRLAVRVLSSRGERPVIGRVHAMNLSDDGTIYSPAIAAITAMVDQVDPTDRAILNYIRTHTVKSSQQVSADLNIPILGLDLRIETLLATGLILRQDGAIQIRDQQTITAIAGANSLF